MLHALPPLVVVVPLIAAAVLLILSHVLTARVPDAMAIATAVATACMFGAMLQQTGSPLVYWFGGWQPANGLTLGIDFVIDRFAASFGLLISVLFAAAFVFAWGYYESVRAHFHILMLLFMAGMTGFAVTHDLFNMFVWFEVMGVAAFA
ncbi:MAG: hypothetical protein ACJ8AW_50405 [Rhodopila sp.]